MAAMIPRVASPRARASTADLGTSGRAHELDVLPTKLIHHPRLTGRRLGGRASRPRHGARLGMQTMSAALATHVRSGRVDIKDAERAVSDPGELRSLLRGAA